MYTGALCTSNVSAESLSLSVPDARICVRNEYSPGVDVSVEEEPAPADWCAASAEACKSAARAVICASWVGVGAGEEDRKSVV